MYQPEEAKGLDTSSVRMADEILRITIRCNFQESIKIVKPYQWVEQILLSKGKLSNYARDIQTRLCNKARVFSHGKDNKIFG